MRDSISRDSVRAYPAHSPIVLLAIPVGLAAFMTLLLAPAPLAWVMTTPDSTSLRFMPNETTISASLGGVFQHGETWTHSVNVETYHDNVHLELLAEDFWRPRHIQYVTIRSGYLWHPRRRAAGGVTIGYMHADREAAQRGPELGLPLFLSDSSARTIRFEPTYVFGRHGLIFNYRMRVTAPIRRTRYFAGATIVGKGNPPPTSSEYAVYNFTGTGFMVHFGTRF